MADERAKPGVHEVDTGATSSAIHDVPLAPTAPAAVIAKARTELAAGRSERARELLEAHVDAERDPEAMKLLGEVLHRMGDLPAAGAVWFATAAKGPVVDQAVAAWREDLQDDFVAMWVSLPASARQEPLTPKLSALRAKALESDPTLDDPHPSARTVSRTEPADRPRRTETGVRRGSATGDVARDAPAVAASADPGFVDPAVGASGAGDAAVRVRRSEPRGSDIRVREARTMGGDDRASSAERLRRAAQGLSADGASGGDGGFDAAKVIAWVLAALFVICAVVGLITILQWIVPGN